jgi:aminoglycoside phosphotransferase (APT) family kinase protein
MPDRVADLGAIATALREAFPELGAIAPLRVLGGGFRSIAVETAGGMVFRVGKNSDAVAGHTREAHLLPALAPTLPVAIPAPRWYAGPSSALPFGAIGYPKLPGTVLQPGALGPVQGRRLAADLARFLLALHRIAADQVANLGLPEHLSPRALLGAIGADALPALRAELTRVEYERVRRWWDDLLADDDFSRFTPMLVHGDLWYESLLVDEGSGTLLGVLDWEDATIGDPARDLATQRHLGVNFAGAVLRGYREGGLGLEPSFERRVRRWWELRELDGVAFAARTNDEPELRDAIRKLRQGPILGT